MKRPADHFVLSLQLGNDAMQSWADVARTLRDLATEIDSDFGDAVRADDSGAVHDANGNRVGGWHTSTGAVVR